MAMTAILYARVSVLSDDGISLQLQEERMRAFCLANGYEVGGSFTEAISGAKASNRAQLQQALEMVCKAKGVLVVFALSRLARSVRDTLAISERLEKAGANLASLNERIDTSSAAGKFFFRLISGMNEFEKDQLAERTTAAMSHLRRHGKRISSRIPLGFDLAADGKNLVENPAEQVTIRQILEWRRAGVRVSTIAHRLRSQGTPTKLGGQWHPVTVKMILERQEKVAAAA